MPHFLHNSSVYCFNKKQTFASRGNEKLLVSSPKAFGVSLVIQQKQSSFLPNLYLSTKQLAFLGIKVSPAALGRFSFVGYTKFFTLGDLCQPQRSLRQFIMFLEFILKFKTTLTRPIGIGLNSKLFSLTAGIWWLNQLSKPRGISQQIYCLLNPLRLLVLLVFLIVSRSFFLERLLKPAAKEMQETSLQLIYAEAVSLQYAAPGSDVALLEWAS